MAVRTKTRRRLKLLILGTLVVCLLGGGGYVLRKRQVAARVLRDRDAGYVLLEQGDYFSALHKIGPYLQRHPDDVEVMLKYAQARAKVEEPNGKHLMEAISLYRRVLELQPDNAEARKQLLDLYLSVAFNTEIMSLTEGHTDPQSLRARSITLARLGRNADAQKLALQYNDVAPQDLQMQMFTCIQMLRGGANANQIVEHALELQKKHPDDPTFELLVSFAYATTQQKDQALSWVQKAISKPIADPDTIDMAVTQLDALGQYDDSLKLLRQMADTRGGLDFRHKLVSRLYQSGHLDQVLEQTADLDKDLSKADVELLGHRALALISLNRRADAQHLIDALAARKGDLAAVGWSGVLAAIPDQDQIPDEKRIIQTCRQAMQSRSDNPYFHLYLGDAYGRLGATDAATDQWTQAATQAPIWATPKARILRLMIASGQTSGLDQLADQCERLAPADAQVLAIVAWAKARTLPSPDAPKLEDVLKLIDRVQQLQPGEELTTGLKLKLLCDAHRQDEARQMIDAMLKRDSTASQGALLAAARASEDAHLGLDRACFDRCRAAHGMTYHLALEEAMQLIRQKQPQQALKQFEASRASAAEHDSLGWQMAWLQVLEQASDPRAAKEWATLADARPEDPAVQHAVLAAPSVQTDRPLIRRAIDRFGAVLGDDGVMWRVADARWIMQGAATRPSASERDQEFVKAASILNDVTRRDPNLLPAQLLLSDCLFRLNNRSGAMEHLQTAAKLAPGSLEISLQLASMLQAAGDFDGAKPYLDRAQQLLEKASAAAATQPSSPEPVASEQAAGSEPLASATEPQPNPLDASWRRLASLLAGRGEVDRAIEILKRVDQGKAPDAGLAQLLARRGNLTDEMCEELLAKPTPAAIGLVADYYASTGRQEQADATLAMLDKTSAAPGEKELARGIYLQRRGKLEEAIQQLRAACTAAPTNGAAWQSLLVSLLSAGHADEAILAATTASQKFPDDAGYKAIVAQADLVRAVSDLAPVRPLLVALATQPKYSDTIVSALNLLNGGRSKQTVKVAADLKPLADRSPSLFALQNLLIEMDLRTGNPDDAATIATRWMQLAPADPLPAQRAAEALAAAAHWDQLIGVAKDWRGRLGSRTLPADIMLANAYLATRDYNSALDQLQPYASSASQDPAKLQDVIPLYARALIGLGRADEARSFFAPALTVNAALRQAWMVTAAQWIADTDLAGQWLRQVARQIPADAINEKLSLAAAWNELARRSGDGPTTQAADAAIAELDKQMHSAPSVTGEQWAVLASLRENTGDDSAAEPAYRASLKRTPDDPIVQNNLAMVIFRRGGDLKEAQDLAQKAVAHPNHPAHANFLDTLAQIQSKLGLNQSAEDAIRQAVQLVPQEPDFRLTLVQVLLDAGKIKESQQAFSELETLLQQVRQRDPKLTQRIEKIREQLTKAASAAG